MKGTSQEDRYTFSITPRSFLLRMKIISDKRCREIRNTHFMFKYIFRKSCRIWDNVEKLSRAGQATDDNRAHAPCMLDTQGCRHTYKHTHTHTICNTYCFAAVTMVTRKRLMLRYTYFACLVKY